VTTGRLAARHEAAALIQEVLGDPRLIPLYRGWGRCILAQLRLNEGAPAEALKELTSALQLLHFAPAMLLFPLALRLRCLLAPDDRNPDDRKPDDRLPAAVEALVTALAQFGSGGSYEVGAHLALAEAHAALGDAAASRRCLDIAAAALKLRAERIPEEAAAVRAHYLNDLPECRRVRELLG
jgi:hypothetical protein